MGSILTIWAVLIPPALYAPPPSADFLDADLIAYFRTDDSLVRSELASRMASTDGATLEFVAGRLHQLPLWQPAEHGYRSFEMNMGDGEPRPVHVGIPPGYDPSRPWPLLIALHGTGGKARNILDYSVSFLGEHANRMIVAAPQAAWNGPFDIHDELETDQPIRTLRELRRRFHIDSNRVFVTGYSKGGHRTCSASVMFADQFAGSLPLAGSMCSSTIRRARPYRRPRANSRTATVRSCASSSGSSSTTF